MELELPLFYVVNPNLREEQAASVQAALSFTPVDLAIITDYRQGQLAASLAGTVLHTASLEAAKQLAVELGAERPVVIVGDDTPLLDAYFASGRKETVALAC